MEELSTVALTEFDAFTRFKATAAVGNIEAGLHLLDKLVDKLESMINTSKINSKHSAPASS